MLVAVRYEIDGLTDHFLMADREESLDGDHWTCSPQSPLGAAVHGARVGERRRFRLPTGEVTAVTLVGAAPYRTAGAGIG